MRILIIEDEKELRESMAEGLKIDGYEIVQHQMEKQVWTYCLIMFMTLFFSILISPNLMEWIF